MSTRPKASALEAGHSYWSHLARHLRSKRMNPPKGYIDWVRSWPRFQDGSVERIPEAAILLHDTRVEEHLSHLGISERHRKEFRTGTTDPNRMFLIYNDDGQPVLLINGGLPGGGGASTQAAELFELGVKRVVHIGTCANMGSDIPSKTLTVSNGSYKDGTALLLSTDPTLSPIARPDEVLSTAIFAELTRTHQSVVRACGYTIGSFYFQPESLVRALVENTDLPGTELVGYIEMEQASVFTIAKLMGGAAASIVSGSDRYVVKNGQLHHHFEDDFDQDEAQRVAIRAAAHALGVPI